MFYGGAIGGALAVMAYAKHRGFLDYRLFDMGAPALAIGYAVGRLGCQLAGDGDYGIPSDLPWAMAYPDGTVPTTDEVHPTPIYEFLVMSARDVVAVAAGATGRSPASRSAGGRCWRASSASSSSSSAATTTSPGPFSLAQFVSVIMIVAGAWWLLRVRGRAAAQSSTTVPSPRSSAPRKARAAAASSSRPTPTDL